MVSEPRLATRAPGGQVLLEFDRNSADAARALQSALERALGASVDFGAQAKALYATDASNYRQVPLGLVYPRSRDETVEAVRICRKHDAPIIARGGGTRLAAQGRNVALCIDFSRHLHAVLEIDPEARLVRPVKNADRGRQGSWRPNGDHLGIDGWKNPASGMFALHPRARTQARAEPANAARRKSIASFWRAIRRTRSRLRPAANFLAAPGRQKCGQMDPPAHKPPDRWSKREERDEALLLPLRRAAAFFKVHCNAVRSQVRRGLTPGAKIGRDWHLREGKRPFFRHRCGQRACL